MVITVMKRSIESELQKQPQFMNIMMFQLMNILMLDEQALEKSKGSDTNREISRHNT